MQSIYRSILKEALSVTWKYKYLWFFGLFASLSGNGGVYNMGFNNFSKVESQGVFLAGIKEFIYSFKLGIINVKDALLTLDVWGVLFALIIILALAFFIWLAVSSQGALIYGIKKARENKRKVFGEAFRQGISKFWPILVLQLLLSVALIASLALVSLPFFILFMKASNSWIWQNILVLLAFVFLVPVAIILSFIVKYASIYVVNENKHVGEALAEAWRLFLRNWIVSLEMGLLLFLINMLVALLLIIGLVFVALPFVMLGMIASYIGSSYFLWLVVILGLVTFIAIMFCFGAFLNVFQMSVWVFLFEQLKKGVIHSKIARWGMALMGKEED